MVAPILAGGLLALAVAAPLAWKWELGVRRAAAAVAALALLSGLLVAALDAVTAVASATAALLVAGITLAGAFGILAYRFYRDPERTPPSAADGLVVSPADGEVIYIRRAAGGRLPRSTKKGRDYDLVELTRTPLRERDAIVIGIAMSFLDVHVNRAPIDGRVSACQHFPGRFGSLGKPEMVYENERATTVFDRGDLQVAMVQIASRLVRQIASYVRVDEQVAAGQRVGVIRLGSQVDVVVPARDDLVVQVAEGDRVRAGESVLALLPVADDAGENSSSAS